MSAPKASTITTTAAERASALLRERRESLSLLRHPFRTTELFLTHVTRWLARQCRRATHSHHTYRHVLPALVAVLAVSQCLVPSYTDHIFVTLDTNKDGLVDAAELQAYFTQVLHRAPQGSELVAETFPGGKGAALDGAAFRQWWNEGPDTLYRQSAFFADSWWREVEYALGEAIYWLVLGVLSSVGLGTGMHSGLLFLFPHIYLTCAAASACGNLGFWTYPTNRLVGPADRVFVCIAPAPKATATTSAAAVVPLAAILLKVVPACVLWGAGTAMGEVPPYALSYAAACQGQRQGELERDLAAYDVLNRMRAWMLDKIQRYGFWAVLLLSAWPNMAFDLCGMACGQFLMPFSTFFSATLIGKALIKVNLQALFFVALFSGDNIERLAWRVGRALASVLPDTMPVEAAVARAVAAISNARDGIAQRATTTGIERRLNGDPITTTAGSNSVHYKSIGEGEGESYLPLLLNWVVVAAVGWFAKSIVEAFAVAEQEQRDEARLQRLAAMLATRKAASSSDSEASSRDDELLALLDAQ